MELKVGDKIKVKGTIFADSLGDIFEAEILKINTMIVSEIGDYLDYTIKAIDKRGNELLQYFDTTHIKCGMVIVSNENFDIIEENRHVNKCSCDIRLLMTSGCKCGGI